MARSPSAGSGVETRRSPRPARPSPRRPRPPTPSPIRRPWPGNWPEPRDVLAETLASDGQAQEAEDAGREAVRSGEAATVRHPEIYYLREVLGRSRRSAGRDPARPGGAAETLTLIDPVLLDAKTTRSRSPKPPGPRRPGPEDGALGSDLDRPGQAARRRRRGRGAGRIRRRTPDLDRLRGGSWPGPPPTPASSPSRPAISPTAPSPCSARPPSRRPTSPRAPTGPRSGIARTPKP